MNRLAFLPREWNKVAIGGNEASTKMRVIVCLANGVSRTHPLNYVGSKASRTIGQFEARMNRDRALDALAIG